jgi:DNA-binding transcriptional MerR regulator
MQNTSNSGVLRQMDAEPATTTSYTIGEVAQLSGCTAEAIRYYEREGVVPAPPRVGAGRYRHYSLQDVDRFRFLRRARELGFPLDEVRNLLALAEGDPGSSCTSVDHLARTHLAQVEAKLAQLTALRDELSRVIDQCEGGFAVSDCRILGALGASRLSPP